jgi:hypothetical protein
LKLYESRDFRQLVTLVAAERQVAEAWIEKDYYLTEVLRIIAQVYPTQSMLKGGTSLSKGWQLLDRISEDIDLFVDPAEFPAGPNKKLIGAKTIDKKFSALKDAIASHPALTHDLVDKHVIGGFARDDRFAYPSIFVGGLITITPSVLVEAGIQSGKYPVETRTIRSLLGDYLEHQGRQDIAEDTGAFELRVLHFRRTFVEKMFAIHGKVERFRTDGERVGRNSRHYADLYVLGEKDEVLQMLKSAEYADICKDYDEKSRQYFANSYRPPQGLRFRDSPALFPAADLRRELERDYDADIGPLFFAESFPSFSDVLGRFEMLKAWL